MILTIFNGFLFFACLFLILYLWRKDPEYPVLAWVSATLFFIVGGGLILTGLTIPTGTAINSTSYLNADNQTVTFTEENALYENSNLVSSSVLGILFILLAVYLAFNPFDLERKKKRKANEENQVELPKI